MGSDRDKGMSHNYLPDATYAFAPFNRPVMTRAEAQSTMRATEGWIMAKGEQWYLHAEDLGAGMCRINLKVKGEGPGAL